MAVDILAGIGAFKSMYDAAKALKDMNDAAIRNGAVIELQSQILAAQEQQSALIQRRGELEREVADLKSWEGVKQRYEMVALAPNVVAFAEKKDIQDRQAPHYLCANCFAAGKKSHFQQTLSGVRLDRFKCNSCGEEISIHKQGPPLQVSTIRPGFGRDGWMAR